MHDQRVAVGIGSLHLAESDTPALFPLDQSEARRILEKYGETMRTVEERGTRDVLDRNHRT